VAGLPLKSFKDGLTGPSIAHQLRKDSIFLNT